jgi:hypothetical protein
MPAREHRSRTAPTHTSRRFVAIVLAIVWAAACSGGSPTPPGARSPSSGGAGSPASIPAGDEHQSATAPSPTWDIILQSDNLPDRPPPVDFLELDGFETSTAFVAAANAAGTKTICYISIGTAESFRPDYQQLTSLPGARGHAFPGFDGDFYLNINMWTSFIPVMDARLRMCRDKGFQLVDFDVIDAFEGDPDTLGFTASEQTQLDYVQDMARRAQEYRLGTVQKNASALSETLEPHFDAALYEECVRLDFCDSAAPYLRAGKPVFNVEYPESWPRRKFDKAIICGVSRKAGVITLFSVLELDRPAMDRC